RVLKALGRVDEGVAVVKGYAQVPGAPLELVAAMYEELGQVKLAEELFRRYMAESPRPESALYLAYFLGRQNRVGEGLDVCEQAMAKCPAELVAIASVDVIRAGVATPEQQQRSEGWLKAAIAKNPKATTPMIMLGD